MCKVKKICKYAVCLWTSYLVHSDEDDIFTYCGIIYDEVVGVFLSQKPFKSLAINVSKQLRSRTRTRDAKIML
jgi:hypothetical protein